MDEEELENVVKKESRLLEKQLNFLMRDKYLLREFEKQKKMLEIIMPNPAIVAAITSINRTLSTIKPFQLNFIPLITIKEIADSIRLTKKFREMKTKKFRNFMKHWGWFLNERTIPFGDYCYRLYKKHGHTGLKYRMQKWFGAKKNLDYCYTELSHSFPSARLRIIKDALKYHLKKNYAFSIVLLLPQTEGLLWELGVKKNEIINTYNSKKDSNGKKLDLKTLSKKLFPKDKFHKIVVKEIFYDGFRNKVLHGRNIHNGIEKEINQWRSTLLILSLWRLADELEK